MPRYFFNLYECGALVVDEEGREIGDSVAIRRQAIEEARQIMSHEVAKGELCLSCRIEVLDADQRPVLILPFKEALTITGS